MKKSFILGLVILVGIFVYVTIVNKVKVGVYPLYVSYTDTDTQLQTLREADVNKTMETTVENILSWDATLFNFVKEKKLPPTDASRLYAYTLAAQREAAFLSFNLHHRFSGLATLASAKVACMLYPSDCETFTKDIPSDAYSEKLAVTVAEQLISQMATNTSNTTAKLTDSEAEIKNSQFRAPNPPVYSEKLDAIIAEQQLATGTLNTTPPILMGDTYWNGTNPTTPEAGTWKTWLIENGSQFRAPNPPEYGLTDDLAQIEAVKKALREITTAQRDAVIYWAGGAGTVTPSGIWIEIATKKAEEKNLKLDELLNLRADLAMTIADAFITSWDSKFTYWTKRPFMRDTTITTLIPTPNFPSYPSGHSTISSAASVVLSFYFLTESGQWTKMAEEARDSRLWSGIHFPVDNEVGFSMGQKVGNAAVFLFKQRTR